MQKTNLYQSMFQSFLSVTTINFNDYKDDRISPTNSYMEVSQNSPVLKHIAF